MAKQDWFDLGNDIRNIVQNAVESQDFHKLSFEIRETITNAGSVMHRSVKDFTAGFSKSKPAVPVLYRKTDDLERRGRFQSTLGGILTGAFGLALLLMLLGMALTRFVALLIPAAILTIPWFLSLRFFRQGKNLLTQTKRFLRYQEVIGHRTYCDVKELANASGSSITDTKKSLKQMLADGWFLEGHLDQKHDCLITTHETYAHYRNLEDQQQRLAQAQASAAQDASEAKKKEEHTLAKLPPEARRVIEKGRDYVRLIRESNDRIPGEEISNKISRLELIVARIFERIERCPEVVSDLHKMMDYYLPTTMKLLNAYEELDRQPVQGDNILSSKREIEETLDTLNVAFERLLDNLFKDIAWDVSTDISVLQTMLAQEGLTGRDFDV